MFYDNIMVHPGHHTQATNRTVAGIIANACEDDTMLLKPGGAHAVTSGLVIEEANKKLKQWKGEILITGDAKCWRKAQSADAIEHGCIACQNRPTDSSGLYAH